MRRILALVVCLGSLGGWPSAATAQSSELAALVAHVQALEATITTQAEQIAALQTAMGTATGPSLHARVGGLSHPVRRLLRLYQRVPPS